MIYIVTFEIHQNCQIHSFVYHCNASNAKEACATAKQAWTENHKQHQFHMHGVKSTRQDPDLLSVHTWNGKHKRGAEVMDTFISYDLHTWRVNGRNLYGV